MPDVSERREAIARLLATRFDGLPVDDVRRQRGYASGFSHRVRVTLTCEDCLANDRVLRSCPTCGGRGYVERSRSRDPYAVNAVSPYGLDGSRIERERARDAELARLEQQTREPRSEQDELVDANEHPFRWERERTRMYAEFDYAALDVALERLAGLGLRPSSEAGLALLEEWLPDPLRAPAPFVAAVEPPTTRGDRDRELRRLASDGRPVQWLAQRYGLSVSQVYRIIAKEVV